MVLWVSILSSDDVNVVPRSRRFQGQGGNDVKAVECWGETWKQEVRPQPMQCPILGLPRKRDCGTCRGIRPHVPIATALHYQSCLSAMVIRIARVPLALLPAYCLLHPYSQREIAQRQEQ